MYIKKLNIDAFGTLREKEIDLTLGLNIIEGANESGKSAAAMFIKFVLYGLSGKATGGEMTERRRYVNWDTGTAGGSMTVADGDKEYRIERLLTVSQTEDGGKARETVRESVRMIDTSTNTVIHKGEIPGEVLFGVPENIFMNTVFVRQIDGTRVNSTGILASIENLLFTADETVSTKKAIDRLDDERRRILHKNGSGGLLHELRTQRSLALSSLREAEQSTGSLSASEAEMDRAKALCEDLRKKVHSQELICKYGALNLIRRRFDAADDTRKKLSEINAKITESEADGITPAYIAQLKEAKEKIHSLGTTAEKLKAARTEAHAQWKIAYRVTNDMQSETEDATLLASSLKSRMLGMTVAAILLLFFALCAGGCAWFLYRFSAIFSLYYNIAVIGAGVFAALGLMFLLLRGKAKRKLRRALASWGAETVDQIPEAIAKKHGDVNDPDKLKDEKQQLDDALTQTLKQRRAEANAAYDLAVRAVEVQRTDVFDDGPEPEETLITGAISAISLALIEAEKRCAYTDSLRSDADTLRGRLSVLEEQLANEDEQAVRETFAQNMRTPEGRIASGINEPRLEQAKNELEQHKEELSAAEKRLHQFETNIAAARAVTVSPTEIADKISGLDMEIEELTKRNEAYCLAIEMLKSASESMRASVLPRVVSEACASANRFAGGSFDAIGVDEALSMNFTRGGQTRDVEYLSEGTKDIAYISLRRALTGVLFDGVHPPLIYDESFARVDETRLERILALLASQEENTSQSLLLSCHKREARIARKIGNVNIIEL